MTLLSRLLTALGYMGWIAVLTIVLSATLMIKDYYDHKK